MARHSLTLLGAQWKRAANDLGVEIAVPYVLHATDGAAHEFACLLPQFGGPKGVLLRIAYDKPAADAACAAGFSVSHMDAETRLDFNLESYIDCLRDWGWTADAEPPPAWYSDSIDAS